MDDKLTTKTAKFTSLENLYVYGMCVWMIVIIGLVIEACSKLLSFNVCCLNVGVLEYSYIATCNVLFMQ